jgi:uncharacterized protein (DUF342 family)
MVVVTENNTIARCEEGFAVTLSDDKLTAFLYLDATELGQREITSEDIIRNLKSAGIFHGLDEKAIDDIADQKLLDKKHVIARGLPPESGRAATFELRFELDRKIAPKEGADGRIDYRDMDFLQNAEPGQVLVKKIPATKGKPGKTVTNEEIPARPGKDKKIPKGVNTELSADGLTLSAVKAGTIVYSGSVASVQPVTTIAGSVDLSTGNINCKGSLKVVKDIKSDFRVDVDGDLDVTGNVEDAEIHCKGNVVVKGGFVGRGDGVINALGDVTVKYVVNQKINSRGNITIGGEVVNAHIHACDRIDMIGSKAKVVGGVLTARKLIKATTIGADAGTRTVLKVAYDANLMQQAHAMASEVERLNDDDKRVKQALVGLYKLKMANRLPPAKESVLKKLEEFKKSLPAQLEELAQQRQEIDKKLAEFKCAIVIAEKDAFPGVQVHIGRQYKEIDNVRGPMIFEIIGDSIVASSFDKNAYEARQRALKQKEEKEAQAKKAASESQSNK